MKSCPLCSADGPTLGYTLLRFTMGVNFLMHGAVRLPAGKYSKFVDHITSMFRETILPDWLLTPYAYAIPPVELIIGALLILGLFTRGALAAGALLMSSFIFGMCLLENWSAVGSQMVYAAIFWVLLHFLARNTISLDAKIWPTQGEGCAA